MNRISKLGGSVACLGALLLAVVLYCFLVPVAPPGYQSTSTVVVQAYTNVFLTPGFRQHMMATVPGIGRLSVVEVQTAPPAGRLTFTSGAIFTIYALGTSATDATNTSNAAALQFQQTVLKDYGISSRVFPSVDVHRHSIYQDVLKPKFEEIFE
jgi:hypothetical protein